MESLSNGELNDAQEGKTLFEEGFFEDKKSKTEQVIITPEIRASVMGEIFNLSEVSAVENLVEGPSKSNDYQRFVDFLIIANGIELKDPLVSKALILNDSELIQKWYQFNSTTFGSEQYNVLQKDFLDTLKAKFLKYGHVESFPEINWDEFIKTYKGLEFNKSVTERVFLLQQQAKEDNDLVKLKKYQEFKEESQIALQDFINGKISEQEYRKVFIDFAKSSDDDELKHLAEEYEQVLSTKIEKKEKEHNKDKEPEPKSNEKPVEEKQEFDDFISNRVNLTGKKYEFLGNGKAEVSYEGYTVGLFLRKVLDSSGKETGRYVIYLVDSNTFGKPEPLSEDQLEEALDQRYLDNIMSDKISENIVGQNYIKDIPDNMIVSLCEKLIGKGSDRDYLVGKSDINLIEKLSIVLVKDSDTKTNLYSKIEVLLDQISSKQHEKVLRDALIKGVDSVDDILDLLQNKDIEDIEG